MGSRGLGVGLGLARARVVITFARAMSSRNQRPRHVDPEVWALVSALHSAKTRIPYEAAEARLLDGLHRFARIEATGGGGEDGVVLGPRGPRWASLLAAVGAVARLCSEPTRRLLAPWTGGVPAPYAAPPGVSPHAGVGFTPYGQEVDGGPAKG